MGSALWGIRSLGLFYLDGVVSCLVGFEAIGFRRIDEGCKEFYESCTSIGGEVVWERTRQKKKDLPF